MLESDREYPGVMLMRAIQTMFARYLLAFLVGLACLGTVNAPAADENRRPIAIQFSFDRPVNAGLAPVILAMTDGLFASEGLAVATNVTAGSPEAIARVASGDSEFALVDLNALIRVRDQRAPPVRSEEHTSELQSQSNLVC